MSKRTGPVWPYLCMLAAGLLLAAFVDLPLDIAVYSPQNALAVFMECYGWYPVALAPLALFVLMARGGKTLPARCSGAAGVIGVLALLAFVSFGYVQKRGGDVLFSESTVALLCVLALVLVWLWHFWRAPAAMHPALKLYAVSGTALAAGQLAVVNVVKLLWNRARFDEMLAADALGSFTPWYSPFGGGGSSFPSGHTANAACFLALVVLCDVLPAWNKRRRLVYALCWGYIAVMAAARVLIGRHFLSDTLVAMAVTALLLYSIRKTRLYRGAVNALAERQNPSEDG